MTGPQCNAPVVAVVGQDGAGKSTLTALLAERLNETGVRARRLDRWDVIGDPRYPAAACLAEDTRKARSCAAAMSVTPRLLFLLWISVLALTDERDAPPDEVVLLDGYWMKHAASEIASGADESWVDATVAGLPTADLVIYLRLDPEVAWQRKNGQPLPYECGMDLSRSHASFLRHQYAIQRTLDRWAAQYNWLVVDAEAPPEQQADRLTDLIANSIAPQQFAPQRFAPHQLAIAAEPGHAD